MPNRFLFAAVIALSVGISSASTAQDSSTPDLDTVVATVNGVEITLGHMVVAKSTLPDQYQQLPADVLFSGILDQLVAQTALVQSYGSATPDRVQLALDNEHRSLIAAVVVEEIMRNAVTERAVQTAYEEKYADEAAGEEYNASHILVETELEALSVQAELVAGGDFAETAREYSIGPSGPNGGSLGWFGTGAMVPSFEAAVIAMRPGDISNPVQTQFGWHIIRLNEIRLIEAPTLDEVRPELEAQIRSDAVQARVDALKEVATIDLSGAEAISPSVINEIDLDG